MATPSNPLDRIIHPVINDDGSVHYPSMMSPLSPNKLPAVCPMLPDRIIPVVFVPGVMGTNLKNGSGKPVWLVDGKISMAGWAFKSAVDRKQILDPHTTDVCGKGALPKDSPLSQDEMRRRGWGEVAAKSYSDFLVWLETHLNDSHAGTDYGRKGLRAELMEKAVDPSLDLPYLTHDEVATAYRYQLPVHAVGYNWLQSNAASAQRLHDQINKFTQYYRDRGKRCEKVILVTHSMGGFVARYFSEVLATTKEDPIRNANKVLGIVHAVMPTTGAGTAYKRVKAGSDGAPGVRLVLGDDAAKVTAVFAQAPGPLQLLPSNDYGKGWLKLRDGQHVVSLPSPNGDPYSEIYLQRGKWWSLIDDRLINPLNTATKTLDQDWKNYTSLIKNHVMTFHRDVSRQYHRNTYAFYGADTAKKAWGDVTWKRAVTHALDGTVPTLTPYISDLQGGQTIRDAGQGVQTVSMEVDTPRAQQNVAFVLQDADENGDGTVPLRSGNALKGERGVQVCVPFAVCDHEGAYIEDEENPGPGRRRFTLWAITKIAYEIRNTALAYRP